MKKLMFAAAGIAVAGGAFAAPTVYDYKASVKHMYLKKVSVKNVKYVDNGVTKSFSGYIYQKYQKSASLKGYLIMDTDGATSVAINTGRSQGDACPATGFDYGRNRGFLVVLNSSAEQKVNNVQVRRPKILPAVLDAKWIDTAWTKQKTSTSGIAEGTLFVGGDSVAPVRALFDRLDNINTGNPAVSPFADTYVHERTAIAAAPAATAPGMTAYADYVWTSVYLFGVYNGPNFFAARTLGIGPFDEFEKAWDANLPTGLQTAFAAANPIYHDTWLNGAGFGKWERGKTVIASEEYCCGAGKAGYTTINDPELVSLSGNLKGGIYICTENGINGNNNAAEYTFFDNFGDGVRGAWEDQFVTSRLVKMAGDADVTTDWIGANTDSWHNDIWIDGAVEQETTDVAYGTWSIKLNTKFFTKNGPYYKYGSLSTSEIEDLNPAALLHSEDATGLAWLCGSIKAAALTLDKTCTWINGNEIYSTLRSVGHSPANIPMVTPQFAAYYGLANWN